MKNKSSIAVVNWLTNVKSWIKSPLSSYYLIIALTSFFIFWGIIMVASASYVTSYTDTGFLYKEVLSQFFFVVLGIVLFILTLYFPTRVLKLISFPALIVTIVTLVLVLVPGIGTEINDSRRWISVGSLTFQPSEFVKVALCLWGANILALRLTSNKPLQLSDLLVPLVPMSVLICFLIIEEPNYSTTMIIALITLILLWYAGISYRILIVSIGVLGVLGILLALTKGYRSARVTSFLNQENSDVLNSQYQITQSKFAFANGGLFGTGLGEGEAKHLYLPNAHNDFLFAIIGEELGLVGCVIILVAFFIFAWVGFRIAAKSVDPFWKMLAATITSLIVLQALLNIGYTVGLLPVTGVQLPLLSAGGTATLSTLIMCALLASAARHEPEAIAAITLRDADSNKKFKLPLPKPYLPSSPNLAGREVNLGNANSIDSQRRR